MIRRDRTGFAVVRFLAMRAAALGLCILVCACAGGQAPPRSKATGSTTRYRVGDYVVYRYSGTFSGQPVMLREQIRGREGNRLRIEVTAVRGGEKRRWVQVVTDTPENQRNNVVDALFEWQGERLVRLANEGGRDILRLYAWTILMPDGRATDVSTAPCERDLAGRRFSCSCTSGRNIWRGRAVRFEDSRCPEFLWTHGPGRFWDEATGQDVLRAEVSAFGRK